MIQRAGLCGDLAGGISLESAEVPFWRSFGMWETKWKNRVGIERPVKTQLNAYSKTVKQSININYDYTNYCISTGSFLQWHWNNCTSFCGSFKVTGRGPACPVLRSIRRQRSSARPWSSTWRSPFAKKRRNRVPKVDGWTCWKAYLWRLWLHE